VSAVAGAADAALNPEIAMTIKASRASPETQLLRIDSLQSNGVPKHSVLASVPVRFGFTP
jgi:hypothetical protein